MIFRVSFLGKIWSAEVNIPCDDFVTYRFFIASIDPLCDDVVHVRRWETHVKPRYVPKGNEPQPAGDIETFGVVDGVEKLDKGWLTNETILQFKFINNPFHLKDRIKNRLLFVKVIAQKQMGC